MSSAVVDKNISDKHEQMFDRDEEEDDIFSDN
jgi:hypothetical protein